MASFLASDEARFITGETVKVDGGLLAQGVALWGTGADNTFMKSAGVNRGTTGEAMVVRNLQPPPNRVQGNDGSTASPRTPDRPAGLAPLAQHAGARARGRHARSEHRRRWRRGRWRRASRSARTPRPTERRDRPHRQIAAGAVGICCAKLGEAEEALGGAEGIDDILITSPIASVQAIARLAGLRRRIARLAEGKSSSTIPNRLIGSPPASSGGVRR